MHVPESCAPVLLYGWSLLFVFSQTEHWRSIFLHVLTHVINSNLWLRTYRHKHTQIFAKSLENFRPKGHTPEANDSLRIAFNMLYSPLAFAQDNQTWWMSQMLRVRLWVSDKTCTKIKGVRKERKKWNKGKSRRTRPVKWNIFKSWEVKIKKTFTAG